MRSASVRHGLLARESLTTEIRRAVAVHELPSTDAGCGLLDVGEVQRPDRDATRVA
jgi:hypothetical protein